MHKNYISNIFPFSLAILVIFGLLSLIDDYGSERLKPINIFSDILTTPSASLEEELHATVGQLPPEGGGGAEIFPCPDSVQCFENYTALPHPFDTLISNLLSKNKQVRIAWFGDSFSEADIVVGDLRDTLQSLYGGNGVGFMPITFEAPGFRRTVGHSFKGWKTRSFITNPKSTDLGISGTVYSPDSAAFVTYEGPKSKHYNHTQKFSIVRLFYTSEGNKSLKIQLNNDKSQTYPLEKTVLPKAIVVSEPDIRRVAVNVSAPTGSVAMYGASLEDETGIYFDNFSIKGNSGLGLLSVREDMLKGFNDLLHYDLLVLQFGLNVAEAKRTDYTAYAKQMTKVIERLKNAFPETPILIISVSDRSDRQHGEYVTLKGVPALLETQRKLAVDNNAIFWNLFEAMGGMNSMPAFVSAKPPLANKDYTHLNYAGSRKIGLSFAESFIHEVEFYKKRKGKSNE